MRSVKFFRTTSGRQFAKIASRVAAPPYEDGLVVSGRTYFYVVAALEQAGRESRFSAKHEPRFLALAGA